MLEKLSKFWMSVVSWFKNSVPDNSDYVDLAPTDKADPDGIYSDALLHATKNPNVYNIALTGPYGSGKSSIIKTFLKRYKKYWLLKKPVLQISLAAFLPEAAAPDGEVTKQEIERSILQQMLYGADANSLPLSRFKRIRSPKWWSWFVWPFAIVGMLACWKLIDQRAAILDLSFFQPLDETNWFNLSCFSLGMVFVWLVLHQIYVKSLGISLRSISLKDIEIKPHATEQESILNRHLDEIIYFFQSTDYDLVVIEDLDRFNNSDIFVTLREINSLINANAGVRRQIRFLYALRDNMFVNTDRTKFFEFIIPVIPIINSSNSIDKIIEQGKRLSLDKRLNSQFLKEVSRYLNDLRLIQNIFNEYAIYRKNLDTNEENILDPNKLLAVLIYKNVLPSDFEELHREKGKLSGILRRHGELITKAEDRCRLKILELEQDISEVERRVPSDLAELRKIYAMALIDKLPQGCAFIEFNDASHIPIQSLWNHENFNELLEKQVIFCRSPQNQRHRVPLAGLQEEVNPDKTYKERKQEIEHRSYALRNSNYKAIRELRTTISSLRMTTFSEVIRADTEGAEELFDVFGENKELVKFLVFEGFLDDSYYQYTSLFHSGRLSPNDNKFLIQIRAFNNPEPDFQIDNPQEVIDEMREDDFRRHFVLNLILVDCILSNPNKYDQQITRLVEFISSNFDDCDEFFQTYYERGKRISELLSELIGKWSGFVTTALESSDNVTHVARFIAHLPEGYLTSLYQKDVQISEFLSTNLSEVLARGIDFKPERLKLIPFNAQELKTIRPYPAVARLLADEGLYKVSIQNIEFIFRDVLGLPSVEELQTKHYSTVLKSGNTVLINKVEDDFEHYLKSILLALENNTEEDVATIINVLKHDKIESEHLEVFLEKQSAKLPSLDDIPPRFYKPIFKLQKIEASWENCLAFITSEAFDAETLTEFLQTHDAESELSSMPIDGGDATLPLRKFLFNNNELEDGFYRTYVRALPRKFSQFPADIGPEKLLILVEEEKIIFSEAAFSHLADYQDYQVLFIVKNIDNYFDIKDELSLDDDFHEKLLNSQIVDAQKLKIVDDMDLNLLAGLPSRASVIGNLFHRTGFDISGLTAEAAQALIVNTDPIEVQVSLFNKCHKILSDDQIRQILEQMPEPFSDFKPGGGHPRIPITESNVELVTWLDRRKIISSWKKLFSSIWVYNYRS
ncbi:DNA-binding protein [Thalassospira sp. MCCC 1A03138]|uniref:YobI family P-loop NTPase n=1 Tax=Thalassospira sp. MCCC 1A03138 TaxID=1470576 RepID=UPI000A1FA3A6|nr:DNA-binding protein [Thalassospira sp. MCCC 1A03138]OSQ31191.1 DNA-binding protein [Thalassospira sp. MCCC 1A03138]